MLWRLVFPAFDDDAILTSSSGTGSGLRSTCAVDRVVSMISNRLQFGSWSSTESRAVGSACDPASVVSSRPRVVGADPFGRGNDHVGQSANACRIGAAWIRQSGRRCGLGRYSTRSFPIAAGLSQALRRRSSVEHRHRLARDHELARCGGDDQEADPGSARSHLAFLDRPEGA